MVRFFFLSKGSDNSFITSQLNSLDLLLQTPLKTDKKSNNPDKLLTTTPAPKTLQMSTTPLLEKPPLNSPLAPKGKMMTALKSKLVLPSYQDPSPIKPPTPVKEVQTLAQASISESAFFRLLENRDEEKLKIEKEMHYIEDLYTQAGYFVDFQANYISEIEKSLQEVETNSKSTAAALKKASSQSDCIQRFLYSIMLVQIMTICVLFVLVWLF